MNAVEFLRSKGYPYRIKGNCGYNATLVDIQPLVDGDYMAIYRYPGGDCCHDLLSIQTAKSFEILEQ